MIASIRCSFAWVDGCFATRVTLASDERVARPAPPVPRGPGGPRDGRRRRGPRVHDHHARPASARESAGGACRRGRGPCRWCRAGHGRHARWTDPGRPQPGRARGARRGARHPQGLAPEPGGDPWAARLGRHDRLGHDDRGGAGRHRGLRHRRHRRRPSGRRVVPGHQRRPRRAGAHAGDGGLRGAEVHPRRRPHRSRRSRPGACPSSAWQSDEVAGFYSRSSGHRAPSRVDSAAEAAQLIATHRRLGLTTGILITVPLPDEARAASRRGRGCGRSG